jgi:predicted GIY-YIG superfamily endonuclease
VGGKRFDRKFGADFLRELPEEPAVYLFKDEAGGVLYAGKAKNVRRRLAGYRNASRRKAHRKMRTLVREAHSLEVRLQPSEGEALLVENELIRTLRPPFNVDGAFDFLYPAIGTGRSDDRLLLCLTTRPEAYAELELRWHGSFRPRLRACEAFDALVDLCGRIGHLEPRSRTPKAPRLRGSRLVALRRMPSELLDAARDFLDGESDALLGLLCEQLLESRAARSDAAGVQEELRRLEAFHRRDVRRLRDAIRITGREARFVPGNERDALFIEARLRSDRKRGRSAQTGGTRRSASGSGRATSGKVSVARDAKVASPVRTMK